jgi:hypothetical protein
LGKVVVNEHAVAAVILNLQDQIAVGVALPIDVAGRDPKIAIERKKSLLAATGEQVPPDRNVHSAVSVRMRELDLSHAILSY